MSYLYNPAARTPVRIHEVKDKDSKYLVPITYIPSAWAANTVYYKRSSEDFDTAVPTTFKGLYARVKHPGKSGATDPFTGTYIEGDEVTDGTCTWEMVNYNLIPIGLTITASTFTASDSVTLTLPTNTTTFTQVKVSTTPATVENFTITNHITLSNAEELDFSLVFTVASR